MSDPKREAADPVAVVDSSDAQRIARDFAVLFHDLRKQTLSHTRWLGTRIVKTPGDIVVLQEIIAETRPELIIEAGVFNGGSTLFYASLLDLLGVEGTVVGIDVDLSGVEPGVADHPRIELIEGSSADPVIVNRLRTQAEGKRAMVDLDSNHEAAHVLAELRALAPLVSPGCYLVIEDAWFGGRPIMAQESSPSEALDAWLAEADQPFEIDRWRERLLLTGFPRGYLRRAGGEPPPRVDERPERWFVPALETLDEDARAPDDAPVEIAGEVANGDGAVLAAGREGDLVELRRTVRNLSEGNRRRHVEREREREVRRQVEEELREEIAAQRELLRERDRQLRARRQSLRGTSGQARSMRGRLAILPGFRSLAKRRRSQRGAEPAGGPAGEE